MQLPVQQLAQQPFGLAPRTQVPAAHHLLPGPQRAAQQPAAGELQPAEVAGEVERLHLEDDEYAVGGGMQHEQLQQQMDQLRQALGQAEERAAAQAAASTAPAAPPAAAAWQDGGRSREEAARSLLPADGSYVLLPAEQVKVLSDLVPFDPAVFKVHRQCYRGASEQQQGMARGWQGASLRPACVPICTAAGGPVTDVHQAGRRLRCSAPPNKLPSPTLRPFSILCPTDGSRPRQRVPTRLLRPSGAHPSAQLGAAVSGPHDAEAAGGSGCSAAATRCRAGGVGCGAAPVPGRPCPHRPHDVCAAGLPEDHPEQRHGDSQLGGGAQQPRPAREQGSGGGQEGGAAGGGGRQQDTAPVKDAALVAVERSMLHMRLGL